MLKDSILKIVKEIQPDFDFPVKEYILFIDKCFKDKLVFCVPYSQELASESNYTKLNKTILVIKHLVKYQFLVDFYGTDTKISPYVNWIDFCFCYGYKQLCEGMWLGHNQDKRFHQINIEEFNKMFLKSNLTIKYLI
jgi:hypothetical protein